jgi:hypothetical protein
MAAPASAAPSPKIAAMASGIRPRGVSATASIFCRQSVQNGRPLIS